MKKTLLTAFSILTTGILAQAQVTITSSDIGLSYNTVKYQAKDTMPGSQITITAAGSGQTWDYTTLNLHDVDTLTFINPATAPNASTFPTANHCFSTLANGNTTYAYLKATTGNVSAIGATVQNPFGTNNLVLKISPAQMIAAFPSSVGSGTTTSYYKFKVQLSGAEVGGQAASFDSVRVVYHGKRLITPDADGTIQTVDGTKNVLRIETISLDTLNTDGKLSFIGWTPLSETYDTVYTYDFWANGEGYPVVTAEYDEINAVVDNVTYMVADPLGLIKQAASSTNAQIFPNPNTGNFKVLTMDNSNVTITDVTGRVLYSNNFESGLTSVSLNEYAGVYLVKTTNLKNGVISTQRLIINK